MNFGEIIPKNIFFENIENTFWYTLKKHWLVQPVYFLRVVKFGPILDIQTNKTGYILGKVAKLHFLQSPQKSFKTSRHSHKKRPLKKIKKLCFFGGSFFKVTFFWHFEFLMNQIFGQRFILFEKWRYRSQLLLKLRAAEVATLFHWISSSRPTK